MDPIKCVLLEKKPATIEKEAETKIELEYADGSAVSANEMGELVDIGRDRWPWKYGMEEGEKIDTFYWSFKNYTTDIVDRKWQYRVFAVSYRTIGFLINKKYRRQRDPNGKAHFRDEFTHDLSVFNDRPGVLAQEYLYMPNMSAKYKGLGQWNDNHFFTPFGDQLLAHLVDPDHYTEGEKDANGNLKMLATQPMLEINMHEKKHGHGYYHDENSHESLMYPYVKPGYNITRNADGTFTRTINPAAFIWTNDDVARWHEGYPARTGLGGWLGRMRARRLRGRFVKGVPYRVAI